MTQSRGADLIARCNGRVLMKNHESRISERCIMYRYIGELVPKSSQPGGSSGRAVIKACPGRLKGQVTSRRAGVAEPGPLPTNRNLNIVDWSTPIYRTAGGSKAQQVLFPVIAITPIAVYRE